jgi:ABC-type sugar transport system substrate-binding protein
MKKRMFSVLLVCGIVALIFAACSETKPAETTAAAAEIPRQTYYYIAPGLGQPYCYDMHLGFKYAAEQFNCEIIQQGGDDWNSTPAAQALEQIIPRNPAGIITVAWDPAMNPGIIKAQQAGIPIILVEAESGEFGDLYIGLDNVDAGRETAELLLEYGGNSGKLLVIGNWGSTNIDQKFIGLKEKLTGTGWQIVGDQDSDADAETSLRAAKDLLNLHPDTTAFVGLDSACGAGIATAMEELGMAPGSLTVICADREDAMLEFIKNGYINAALTNRTAMMCYLAVQFLENITKYGFYDIPITANNKAAGISVYPKQVYTGNVVITKDNVNDFDHNQMDSYDTPLYH